MLSGSAASRVFGVPYGTRAGNDGSARACTGNLIRCTQSPKQPSRDHRGSKSDFEGLMLPMEGFAELIRATRSEAAGRDDGSSQERNRKLSGL